MSKVTGIADRPALESRKQSTLGQDGRMKAAGNLLQFLMGLSQARSEACQLLFEVIELGWHRRLGHPRIQRECNQVLLRSIVQVAFNATPSVVGGRDDPRP